MAMNGGSNDNKLKMWEKKLFNFLAGKIFVAGRLLKPPGHLASEPKSLVWTLSLRVLKFKAGW